MENKRESLENKSGIRTISPTVWKIKDSAGAQDAFLKNKLADLKNKGSTLENKRESLENKSGI